MTLPLNDCYGIKAVGADIRGQAKGEVYIEGTDGITDYTYIGLSDRPGSYIKLENNGMLDTVYDLTLIVNIVPAGQNRFFKQSFPQ